MLDQDNNLRCAHCGEVYLHHHEIQVFARPREDGPSFRTALLADSASMGVPVRALEGNPSTRRSGVKVLLSCELCPGLSALTIAQHKGFTILECVKASSSDYAIERPAPRIDADWGEDWDPFAE